MKQLPDFNAVIFDMDGLVLDTETTYFSAWQQAADTLGYTISDAFCVEVSGMPFSHIEQQLTQYLGVNFPLSEFYRLSSIYWRAAVERDGINVKAGVYDVLQVLDALSINYCLATNSPETNARECLQYAGIADLFSTIVSRDHVPSPKPAADIFLQAASILEQPIAACLVVEDSFIGLLAAKNANAFSVLVPSMPDRDGKMQALAGLVLNDLSELAKLVQEK